MGLFTPLDDAALAALLARWGLALRSAEGIPAGSVNTYYRVVTDAGPFFLRVDERADASAVDHELAVLDRVTAFAVPRPRPTPAGARWISLGDKPVVLFSEVPGVAHRAPELGAAQLASLGRAVAAMHRADASGLAPHRFHPRALIEDHYAPLRDLIARERPDASAALEGIFGDGWSRWELAELPRSVVHADLFADNLHYDGDALVGILDFEAAGAGPRILDVAIAVHALCFDVAVGRFTPWRAAALVGAYAASAGLTDAERARWRDALTYGASRFLLTRVRDFDLGAVAGAQSVRKDYREYLAHLAALDDVANLAALTTAGARGTA